MDFGARLGCDRSKLCRKAVLLCMISYHCESTTDFDVHELLVSNFDARVVLLLLSDIDRCLPSRLGKQKMWKSTNALVSHAGETCVSPLHLRRRHR